MRPVLALIVVLLLVLPAAAAAQDAPTAVIVRFDSGTSASERADARSDADVRLEADLPAPATQLVDPDPGVSVDEAVAALEDDPAVAYAEPDLPRRAFATLPDDRYFGSQWALRNIGQSYLGRSGTPGADIAVTDAWDVTTGDPAVTVAVVDSGADLDHPDLAPNLTAGFDFVDDDAIAEDGNGHGTHVAGTAGARGNDATGVTGVAWTTTLMPLRVLDGAGNGTVSDAIRAYAFAAANGAQVVNLSLGGETASRAERDAIAAAPRVLFVAAAGNEGLDLDQAGSYPCEYDLPNVVCVAASDRDDALAGFSNFGDESVDLAAPGTDIASTYPAGTYTTFDGTSMATPHVSGAAALLLAARPDLGVAGLRAALLDGAEPRPALAGRLVTGGRLDVPRALGLETPATRESGGGDDDNGGGGDSDDGGDDAPAPAPAPVPPPAPPSAPLGPLATPAPADRTAPSLAIRPSPRRSLAALTRRGLRVTIRCSEACALRLRLAFRTSADARRARLPRRTLATRTARRTAAGAVTLTLRLSARERARLRRLPRTRLVLTVVASDPAGNRQIRATRLSLRR